MDLDTALANRTGVHDLAQILTHFGVHHVNSHCIQDSLSIAAPGPANVPLFMLQLI
jgi:hypothetical protein